MARKKGRDISGWIVIDKPAGMTSTAVVGKVRWAFDAKKAGHAGTLDPAATGVLAIALGEATKTVPFITDALKCYRFAVRWGAATATDDAEGEVIGTSAVRPSDEAIRAALGAFRGEIMQVPPQYSAVKVEGQRAYDLAREGEEMDLAARPLWVESLELLERPDASSTASAAPAARISSSGSRSPPAIRTMCCCRANRWPRSSRSTMQPAISTTSPAATAATSISSG